MKNVIAFRKRLVCLPEAPKGKAVGRELALTVAAEIMQFGFMPNESALSVLEKTSKDEIVKFHDEVIDYLLNITGGKGSFRAFWKNFPADQMDKSEAELLAHMLLNYWTGGAYEPNEFTGTRPTAYEQATYTTLNGGTEEEFKNIFKDLVSVNQSLTPEDLEAVKWFASNVSDLPMPSVIPFKETLCSVAALGLDVPVKTPTDVLRIAVSMSEGDVALPKVPRKLKTVKQGWRGSAVVENPDRAKFKFRKFSRAERRQILSLLEKTSCDVTEAVLKDQRWVRLGEILHPGEFSRKFPKAFGMFNSLRNDKIQSWYGNVNSAFSSSQTAGIETLAQRPGEFVRKLDYMVRTFPAQHKKIFDTLEALGDRVSNKVLYETFGHFEKRKNPTSNRAIMIKGARKRTKLKELPALDVKVIDRLQTSIQKTLLNKFSKLERLGGVWISEDLKKLPVPTNMRSLNPALKPLMRGTSIPFENPDAKVIRAFLHFKKDSRSITIDLSAIVYGTERAENFVIDWARQKPMGNDILHSGDSFARTGDCAEYVDINVEALVNKGYRYVLIQLHNYTNSPALNDNNFFGVMERTEAMANKLWVPKTISNCYEMKVVNRVNCAVIDLVDRSFILVDEDAGDSKGIQMASVGDINDIKNYFEPPKFSVYDLALLHTEARGDLVANKEDAETVFELPQFTENYVEIMKLMGV